MRRSCVILPSLVVIHLMSASPAMAWWDYIEQFSGPGPWRGFDIEARLWCLMERDPPVNGSPFDRSFVPGLILSACELRDDTTLDRRRASFDLGMRFVWTHDGDYASGRRISLTTLEPAFSWNLIPSKKFDIVHYGIGAGVYWVSSEEFPSFRGAFLEPIRLDFHAPTVLQNRHWGLLGVRFSLLNFPAGFAPDAFAPSPAVAKRIGRDWVPSVALFIEGEKLFRMRRQ